MTRDKKTSFTKSSIAKDGIAADPNQGVRPLSADLQAHIGVRLKALYDSVLSEPIPDRFAELLARLDQADAASADEAEKTTGEDSEADARL